MKSLIERALVSAASVYTKLVPGTRLSEAIHSSERALSYSRDETGRVAKLVDRKIVCLDIGARGGIPGYLEPYQAHLDMIVAEADPSEIEALKANHFRTIEGLLAGQKGTAVFNVTRNPANASMLDPIGPIMSYYAGGDLERFEILKRPVLPTVTLNDVAADLGEGALDYIKLDTQGSELAILEAGERARPLFVVTEASTAALYRDQGLVYDIGSLLHGRGYILFDLTLRRVRPRPDGKSRAPARPSLGLPLHGDAYFMPDWSRPEGLALIAGRERVWAALMMIHGLEDVLRYVLSLGAVADGAAIEAVLDRNA